jgi:hypothetical protein
MASLIIHHEGPADSGLVLTRSAAAEMRGECAQSYLCAMAAGTPFLLQVEPFVK